MVRTDEPPSRDDVTGTTAVGALNMVGSTLKGHAIPTFCMNHVVSSHPEDLFTMHETLKAYSALVIGTEVFMHSNIRIRAFALSILVGAAMIALPSAIAFLTAIYAFSSSTNVGLLHGVDLCNFGQQGPVGQVLISSCGRRYRCAFRNRGTISHT